METMQSCIGSVFVESQENETNSRSTIIPSANIARVACGPHGDNYYITSEGQLIDITTGMTLNDLIVKDIAIGQEFHLAIDATNNKLYSWGNGPQGELGVGHVKGSEYPVELTKVANKSFISVSAGEFHAVALDTQGIVYSWGRGFEGQLGQAISKELNMKANLTKAVCLVPRPVQALISHRVTSIACGSRFTCCVDAKGFVWSWGEGLLGQLGTGRCGYRSIPKRVIGPITDLETKVDKDEVTILQEPEPLPTTQQGEESSVSGIFTAVACGSGHVLALREDGQVIAWGFNAHGQLGLHDRKNRMSPTKLLQEHVPMKQIVAHGHRSAALDMSQGFVYTWGNGVDVPTQLPMNEDHDLMVHEIALGSDGIVAVVPVSVFRVIPCNGVVQGGDVLSLVGIGFGSYDDIKVRFAPTEDGVEPLVVDGTFDTISGTIRCATPAVTTCGTVQVQVSICGKPYTSANVQYTYAATCSVSTFTPEFICCSPLGIEEESSFCEVRIVGENLLDSPDLCIRLQNSENHLSFDTPALMKSENDATTVVALVDRNKCNDILGMQDVADVILLASNNGLQFVECPQRIRLARPSALTCVPCVVSVASPEVTTMSCVGIPHCATIDGKIRISNDFKTLIVDAQVNAEEQTIQFSSPSGNLAEFGLDSGYGSVGMEVLGSIDNGQSWFLVCDQYVLYHGLFQTVYPEYISDAGGSWIELRASEDTPGWIIDSPYLKVQFGIDDIVSDCEEALVDENGTMLRCRVPALEDLLKRIHESYFNLTFTAAKLQYIEENPLEEIPDEEGIAGEEEEEEEEEEEIVETQAVPVVETELEDPDQQAVLEAQRAALEEKRVELEQKRAARNERREERQRKREELERKRAEQRAIYDEQAETFANEQAQAKASEYDPDIDVHISMNGTSFIKQAIQLYHIVPVESITPLSFTLPPRRVPPTLQEHTEEQGKEEEEIVVDPVYEKISVILSQDVTRDTGCMKLRLLSETQKEETVEESPCCFDIDLQPTESAEGGVLSMPLEGSVCVSDMSQGSYLVAFAMNGVDFVETDIKMDIVSSVEEEN